MQETGGTQEQEKEKKIKKEKKKRNCPVLEQHGLSGCCPASSGQCGEGKI